VDIFQVRDRLVEDYRELTGSFVDIHDKAIREHVADRMANGYQWPDPWLSLNPSFASGRTVSELIEAGLLQPRNKNIFRLPNGQELRLHKHQKEAIEAARTGQSYVLTTGTGSGKSLAYIVPIVDKVLEAKAAGTYQTGIKAIVVQPMNALANSQLGELEKFLGTNNPQVTFERYTGQESRDKRAAIIANPPDILLTNYVMLELVLTRPRERGLVRAARGLWFLVLDELHTYRGRQGADVALLVRRLRDSCEAPDVQCVGTSATMTTEGDAEDQRKEVARTAQTLFGVPVDPVNVIGETLQRITAPAANSAAALHERRGPGFAERLQRVHHGPAGHLDRGGLRVRARLADGHPAPSAVSAVVVRAVRHRRAARDDHRALRRMRGGSGPLLPRPGWSGAAPAGHRLEGRRHHGRGHRRQVQGRETRWLPERRPLPASRLLHHPRPACRAPGVRPRQCLTRAARRPSVRRQDHLPCHRPEPAAGIADWGDEQPCRNRYRYGDHLLSVSRVSSASSLTETRRPAFHR
jgi:hypothetical protein